MITNEVYFFKNQSSVSTSDSLYNVNDGTLILQVDGNVSNLELLVLGNTDLIDDDFVALKTINASDYSMSDKITSTGIYWIDINGIRKIKLNLSKITGSVNVKALTKRGLTTDLVARAMAANASGGSSYTLPVASADTLGGIKIGENLTIDENGVVSASGGNDIEIRTINIPYHIKSKISFGGGAYINISDKDWINETNKVLNEIYQNQSTKKYLILFKDIDGIHGFKSFTDIPAYNSSGEKSFSVTLLFDCEYGNNQSIDNFTRYFFQFDLQFCANITDNIVDIDQTKLTTSYNLVIVPQTTTLGKGDGYRAIYLTNGAPLGIYNRLSYTPTSDYNPATKKYVDDAITTAITTSLEGSY